jgi:glutamine synthetase
MTPGSLDLRGPADELEREGVRAVRVLYADLHGVARGKDVPVSELPALAEDGLAFCAAVLTTDLRQTPVVDDEDGYADLVARPDSATLRILPWQPSVAWCVADLWQPGAAARWPSCPRGAVARVAERYQARGLEPIVGPELEFFLLERDAAAPRGYRRYVDELSRSYTVGYVSDPRGVVVEMLDACERLGLQAVAANHEFSNSQYEINVRHSFALDAADRAFLLKTAVKEQAARAGLVATFMGKPFNDQGGSGLHLHLSLATDGENLFSQMGDRELVGPARHVVGGILEHAPALMAVLAPTVNAYKRIVPDSLAPTHANWGYDNRTAFVRVPVDRGRGARLEIRGGDGSANAHLAIAAVLAAGLDGLERELEPPAGVTGVAYRNDGTRPLPRTLSAALDLLEADEYLVSILGRELVDAFTTLKRYEAERFDAYVTDWELEEYAAHL